MLSVSLPVPCPLIVPPQKGKNVSTILYYAVCVCVCVCTYVHVYICAGVLHKVCRCAGVLHKVCQTAGFFMTKNSRQEKKYCSVSGGEGTVIKTTDSLWETKNYAHRSAEAILNNQQCNLPAVYILWCQPIWTDMCLVWCNTTALANVTNSVT
jgi:hypothetical protein